MNVSVIKDLAVAISVVVIPIVVLVAGSGFSEALKERELEGEFVKLAIDVLRDKPSTENKKLRVWSVRVIDKYSGVPFTDEEKIDLIENIQLPTSSFSSNSIAIVWGLDNEKTKKIQIDLTKLGYYSGPIDGVFGLSTKNSFNRFRKANGFKIFEMHKAIKELRSVATNKNSHNKAH